MDAFFCVAERLNATTRAVTYELAIDGDVVSIVTRHRTERPEIFTELAVMTEYSTAIIVRRLREALGESAIALTAVRFVHPAPPSTSTASYEAFFRAPVVFGAALDEIEFRRELLDAPLLTADPILAEALGRASSFAAAGAPPADPFVDRLRASIARALEHGQSGLGVHVLAADFGVNGRTLQRRLKEKRLSLSKLIDDVRRERAAQLLSVEGTLLCDVAYRLGFSGLTPFCRAFRRWTGMSPRAFRSAGEKA
jgi:AraC-like DNA-binding protein